MSPRCATARISSAAAYTLYLQKHIRTDFISQRWSLKTQVRMDIAQYLLLFLPGMIMFTWLSWDFAEESWELGERLMTTWRPPVLLVQDRHSCELGAARAAGAFRSHQVLQDAADRHRLSEVGDRE